MRFTFLVAAVIIAMGFIFWKDVRGLVREVKKTDKVRMSKDNKNNIGAPTPGITVTEKWELPADLKEVSGIAYMDEQRFACVQDEEGTIFIFNRKSKQVEKEIPFAGTGDYEGITVKGNMAYVVRADGMLYEIDMNAEKNSVKEFKTPLTADHNIEGLCYDKDNDRLLLAMKNDEPGNPGHKSIYAFDLSKKIFIKEPAFKIDLANTVFNQSQGKKNKAIMPSAIGIHPATKDIFITDGPNAGLLIMDNSGVIKKLYKLDGAFAQPEGITFSPQGEMFISNEGTKQPGNILKIELEKI